MLCWSEPVVICCVNTFENVRDQPDASDRRISPTVSIVTGRQTHKIKAGLCGQTDRQLQAQRGEGMVCLQVWGHSLNCGVTGSVACQQTFWLLLH